MEVLKSDYLIENIIDGLKADISTERLLLWVWHADKIPPHIGISFDNEYFSLKANGKDENLPLENILSLISRKNIKTLCFELDSSIKKRTIMDVFSQYKQTIPFQITCLDPIKKVLEIPFARKLTDLLDVLYSNGLVIRVIGFSIDEKFQGIRQYSEGDINTRLLKLQ
tara:strand:+ start:3445 stop:3948 length:504 start_codon:yes stop_codon:yes gene_type:complete